MFRILTLVKSIDYDVDVWNDRADSIDETLGMGECGQVRAT